MNPLNMTRDSYHLLFFKDLLYRIFVSAKQGYGSDLEIL